MGDEAGGKLFGLVESPAHSQEANSPLGLKSRSQSPDAAPSSPGKSPTLNVTKIKQQLEVPKPGSKELKKQPD